MSYSVGVQNIFELLDDETDDQPQVKTPKTKLENEQTKQVQKPVAKKSEGPVGDRPAKGAARDQNRKEGGNAAGRSPRTGDRPPRADRPPREGGDRPPRADRPPRGDRPPREGGDRPPRENRGPRPEGDRPRKPRYEGAPLADGERKDRGPRTQFRGEDRDKERWQKETREYKQGGDAGQKRVYDRRSGTGRGPKENKKGGSGAANWGSEKDPKVELEEAAKVKDEAKAEQAEEGAPAAASDENAPAADPWAQGSPAPEKKEPEEPEGVTLDEFLKQKKEKMAALPTLPPPRKAGEGVADKEKGQWAQVSTKTEEENKAVAAQEQKKEGKSAKKETVPLDQLFTIKPRERPKEDRPRRERDGEDRPPRRDNKGGDKRREGGKPKEGGKKPANKGPEVTIAKNDQEFPTLATKA